MEIEQWQGYYGNPWQFALFQYRSCRIAIAIIVPLEFLLIFLKQYSLFLVGFMALIMSCFGLFMSFRNMRRARIWAEKEFTYLYIEELTT